MPTATRVREATGMVPDEKPVTRLDGETMQMFGRRRKTQVARWYRAGVEPRTIARIHGVSIGYVQETVGIPTPGYEWVPPVEVLNDVPTFEEAWREDPLVPEDPRRMTTEQAQARAVQMYRWLQAGLTLTEIADRHQIRKQRVNKILAKFGLWGRHQTNWRTGTPVDIPPPEDNIAGGAPWFFRRRKESGEKVVPWWERQSVRVETDE